MNRFAGFKNLMTGMFFCVAIIVGILFVIWIILSIIGNCAINEAGYIPDIDDAKYEIRISATGESLFAKEYDNPSDGIYILHGYYEYKDDKFRWHKSDLKLDEFYYGKIEIIQRFE